jgi:three-Cys-motif partner protein
MRSVEIFFNFMVVGANRNVLWRDPARVSRKRRELMNRVWGDESWLDVAYRPVQDLFGTRQHKIGGNDALIDAYRKRPQEKAGFGFVPEPIPMKNSRNATVYYLFFASPNATANKIVTDIFRKYRERQ